MFQSEATFMFPEAIIRPAEFLNHEGNGWKNGEEKERAQGPILSSMGVGMSFVPSGAESRSFAQNGIAH